MSYTDKILNCIDCKKEFVFTAGEQEFHDKKGFTEAPKRCTDCRAQRRAQGGSKTKPSQGTRYPAVCTRCGNNFDAPFEPKPGRGILCRNCFQSSKVS